MIPSGSHSPGVSVDDFRLPPHTALRYEKPANALARHLTSYVVMDSEPPDAAGMADWMLPNTAQIWVVFAKEAVGVTIGNRSYPALASVGLVGPTSRAMPVTSNGGISIAIDVTPLGWARLFRVSADSLADRMIPLDTVMAPATVEALRVALQRSDQALDVKPILDAFFATELGPEHPDEPLIAAMMAAIMDDATLDAQMVADRIGIDQRTARRIAKRYFGFTTKVLLLRARFLKAVLPLIAQGTNGGTMPVPPRYHDASHFNRDGCRFLGTTPRRFVAFHRPYLEAALRARVAVMGTALPALDVRGIGEG